jgi:3-methylcrotonyl-CoA carboxylase alpha subunit
MLRSVLIANRGEIARRVIRTARRLGVRTVAVYSDADANALHVREADTAVHIGPPPARESYLVQQKILDAAKATGAEAIHPGYGFLSENAKFADAVKAAGLIWVGPPASSILAMGLKDAAKKLMSEAGVPVTPGYLGEDQNEKTLESEAAKIGYPVLIKAVAGGGGKGMRRVNAASEFSAALASAKREAAASFGDDRVLIEKYVTRPRHIEVQVFADQHGNAVHLFERDCSLQRRHQKVIEEAPAPGMDAQTRAAVCDAAVKAAKAIKYEGAGTVEFIADASEGLRADRIWFMEMNTRLQVEHPVTETITGQDLVEWQLRVASGEKLPLTQSELKITGHAMEARLYAENPVTGFLPSTGPLTHFRMPKGVRVDSAVEEGGEVSPFYDPMIAKVIAAGTTRAEAAANLGAACAEVEVWPVRTNAGFLRRALADQDFIAGKIDTAFIEQRLESLVPKAEPSPDVLQAGARARIAANPNANDPSPWSQLQGFRIAGDAYAKVRLNGAEVEVSSRLPLLQGRKIGDDIVVFDRGDAFAFSLTSSHTADAGGAGGSGSIVSPMPGKVISVKVKAGDTVTKGQALLILEAMKMEHTLTAPFDGKVASLNASEGGQAVEGTVLAVIEASAPVAG